MKKIKVIIFFLCLAAPTDDLQSKFNSLQDQLTAIQNSLNKRSQTVEENLQETGQNDVLQRNARYMSFQPMKKRMVSWQPMKRSSDYTKEQGKNPFVKLTITMIFSYSSN